MDLLPKKEAIINSDDLTEEVYRCLSLVYETENDSIKFFHKQKYVLLDGVCFGMCIAWLINISKINFNSADYFSDLLNTKPSAHHVRYISRHYWGAKMKSRSDILAAKPSEIVPDDFFLDYRFSFVGTYHIEELRQLLILNFIYDDEDLTFTITNYEFDHICVLCLRGNNMLFFEPNIGLSKHAAEVFEINRFINYLTKMDESGEFAGPYFIEEVSTTAVTNELSSE